MSYRRIRQIIAGVINESQRGRGGVAARLPDQFGSNKQMRDAADDMHPEDFPLLDDPEEDIPAWGSFETSAREREVPGEGDRGGYHSKAFGTDAHLARALGRPQREVRIYEADSDEIPELEPPTVRMPRKSTGTGMSGRPAYVPPAAPPKGKTREIEQQYRGEQYRGERMGPQIDLDLTYDALHPDLDVGNATPTFADQRAERASRTARRQYEPQMPKKGGRPERRR